MALTKKNLDLTGSASKGSGSRAIYGNGDDKATILGAGYFNAVASEMLPVKSMLVVASDATFDAKVVSAAGVVTLTAMDTFA